MSSQSTSPSATGAPLPSTNVWLGWFGVAPLWLGIIAASTRLYAIWRILPHTIDTENMRVGFALAARGEFSDPFILPTGPTAHIAPAYPALLALCVRLTGDNELGLLVARSVIAVLFSVFVALLPQIASWLGFERKAGFATALVLLLPTPPIFMWIEATGQHETVLTTILFSVSLAATVAALRSGQLSARRAVLLGSFWGLTVHSSPVAAPPLLAILFCALVSFGLPRPQSVRFAALLLGTVALMVTPWTIRNHQMVGGYPFIRNNFGLELAVSNSDSASADMMRNMGATMRTHPFFDRGAATKLREVGEHEYYREQTATALDWIRTYPRRFIALTAERVFLFFLPESGRKFHPFFYFPIPLLAACGLVLLARRDAALALTLGAALLAYAAPHFVVQSSPRYSYPVLWLLVILASDAGLRAWRWIRLRRRPAVLHHSVLA